MSALDPHTDYSADDFAINYPAGYPLEDYPAPDSSHLLSEIGYNSLPPPDPAAERPPHYGSLANYGSPTLPDSTQHDALPRNPTRHDAIQRDGSPSNDSHLTERFAPQWSDLLRRAVEEPGLISEAYSRFHGYSLGNRFAALLQCQERGLEPGPISTFHGWRRLGYTVQEGEHAISLCMPLKGTLAREKAASPESVGRQDDPQPDPRQPDIEEIEYIRAFVWKPHWFVLAQTQPLDPDNVQPLPVPTLHGWDKAQALAALNIQELPFAELDGNAQGYAQGQGVAVSPLAVFPYKTLFHEMAHVVLGHTTANGSNALLVDTESLSRSTVEVEAEGTALLLLDTLDLPGQEYARGYIQHWLEGEAIPEKSAQRIFGAADRILSAGLGEGRTRFPTAEDLAWPPGGQVPEAATLPANGTIQANGAATDNGTIQTNATPPANGAIPTNGALPANGALPVTATASVDNAQGINALTRNVLTMPDGAEHAWKLHDRLMRLHGELHPDDQSERLSIARAVRYVERLDPEAAAQVRELVSHASLSMKAAFALLEDTDAALCGTREVARCDNPFALHHNNLASAQEIKDSINQRGRLAAFFRT